MTTQPQDGSQDEPQGSSVKSFLIIGLVALIIVGALLALAVFGLGESSVLPFNYQGFDK